MFSNKKTKGSRLIAENDTDYIFLNPEGESNQIKSYSKFEIIPKQNGRESLYVTGKSGSGKTTWICNYVKKYHKIFPKNDIYLFSGKSLDGDTTNDDGYDKLKYLNTIPIDDRLLDDPIEMNELKDSLVIFDDVEKISNKKLLEIIYNLISKILNIGRSSHISCILVSHLINPKMKHTRDILLEVDWVVFFKNSNVYGDKYFLKHYAGVSEKKIDELFQMKTRAYVYHKNFPSFLITDHEIKQF